MKLTLYISAWLYLAAILAAQCGPVAPPNFRALPGVGAFTNNQSGCWVGSAKQFRGGPITESFSPIASSDLLSGLAIDYYSGNVVSPSSYSGSRVTQFYSRLDAPGDANSRAGTFELRGSGNNPGLLSLTGASYYTGAGTTQNLRALAGLAINQGVGTSTLSEGVLGLSSNTGAGTSVESDAVRGRVINSAGTTTVARAVYAQAILSGGTVPTAVGVDIGNWASGATVSDSYAIRIDSSVDQGTTRHAILSQSASASIFTGDVGVVDSARGVLLKSPNGHIWRMTFDDSGNFHTTDLGAISP